MHQHRPSWAKPLPPQSSMKITMFFCYFAPSATLWDSPSMTNVLLGVLFYLLVVCLFLVYLDVLLFEKIQDYKEEDLEP
jgi:hypothetical protein